MTTVFNHDFTVAETAQVGDTFVCEDGTPNSLCVVAALTYGSGGTSVAAYLQTKIGDAWVDAAAFKFTTASASKLAVLSALTPITTLYTPTDGALADNTVKDGVVGTLWRVKYTSVGTYAGTTLKVDVLFNGPLSVRRIA